MRRPQAASVESVAAMSTVRMSGHEVGAGERLQVLGDLWLAEAGRVDEFGHRRLVSLSEDTEKPAPIRLGEDVEGPLGIDRLGHDVETMYSS